MNKIYALVDERYVNPLFEVFDGGDFILSSYRDIEEPKTQIQIFFPDEKDRDSAVRCLQSALDIVGAAGKIEFETFPDEDWKLAYRRHFKTERIGKRLIVHPPWEEMPSGGVIITLDPGMAFGTGKHETTRACLEYIDELADPALSLLDMGCGSGILSIAAAKLGYREVRGFDVDQEAVDASIENAALNGAKVEYFRYGLGAKDKIDLGKADLTVANILGPLLIRFADEIAQTVNDKLVISGILTEIYPEVLEVYTKLGFKELSRKTIGEWTTGLLGKITQ